MIYYMPLEGYKERYTWQWSAPKTGWLERNWIRAKVPYHRIDPGVPVRPIKTGSVVDGVGRSLFTFSQIQSLLEYAEQGKIEYTDVIFLDDFWTPGFEALPYAFHLLGIKPRIYAFLHAQSVDEFDFTYPMRKWMRMMESGYARAMEGIFVCCPTLNDLVINGGIAPTDKVHITGHPFSSEEVMERMPEWYQLSMETAEGWKMYSVPRKDQVVWSSRWDREKDPLFFLQVAEKVIHAMPDTKFIVCTSAPKLRSNDGSLLLDLDSFIRMYPNNLILKEGLTKEQYYATLCESKVQFNCALQDFVAITLLEATVAGCYPIYPHFRSFPETFLWGKTTTSPFMYTHQNIDSAVHLLLDILKENALWSHKYIQSRSWIYRRFDTSWIRMLRHMNKIPIENKEFMMSKELAESRKDPYSISDWM